MTKQLEGVAQLNRTDSLGEFLDWEELHGEYGRARRMALRRGYEGDGGCWRREEPAAQEAAADTVVERAESFFRAHAGPGVGLGVSDVTACMRMIMISECQNEQRVKRSSATGLTVRSK